MPTKPKHTWQFIRVGGFTQVRLRDAADLLALGELDQKLWAALSCPTEGLELDPKTLKLIDADGDGRVRAQELLAAIAWTGRMLKDPEVLTHGSGSLALAAIDDSHEEGRRLKASANRILASIGREGGSELSATETEDTQKIFANTRFNGDGIIPADAAPTPELKQALEELIKCVGSVPDRSGQQGVDLARVEQFFTEAAAFDAWNRKAAADASLLPLGEATAAASKALEAVRSKIEDFFLRCRFAAFDPRFQTSGERELAAWTAVGDSELAPDHAGLSGIPLATPGVGRELPLGEGVNPMWSGRIAAFLEAVVQPVLGARTSLSEPDWRKLLATFAPFQAWQAEAHGPLVEGLGAARIATLLGDGTRAQIEALIARDLEVKQEAEDVFLVDRLVRYNRDLFRLARNYVSFQDFYAQDPLAIFQAGTLYIDTRSCELCIRIQDVAKHSAGAALSRGYLVYCNLTRRATGETMSIVAVVSNGDAEHMLVGRNGIFYDRQDRDWDATIVKVIDNPMSLNQALWAPYRKIAKLVETQIESFAAAREKEVESEAATAVKDGAAKVTAADAKPVPVAGFDVARFAGIFAAIGLAIGAIGGALGAMLSAFSQLAWWQMPLAILGLLLVVSGPSMLLAWLKLRQRSLAPLLDANGWAVNSRIPLSVGFGETLTHLARIPLNARVLRRDPYERPNYALQAVVSLFVAVSLAFGGYHAWSLKLFPWQTKVEAPAAGAPPADAPAAGPAQAVPAPK